MCNYSVSQIFLQLFFICLCIFCLRCLFAECRFTILTNVQGLLLCWNFIMSGPEPLLIAKLKLK